MKKFTDRSQLKSAAFHEVDAAAEVKFKDFEYAWKNPRHELPNGKSLTMKDAFAMFEAPIFFPKVINQTVQEAIEPLLIAAPMLQRVPFMGVGTFIDYQVMGALDGDFEVGETEAFPELRVTIGPGAQIASGPAKYGVAIKFTEEALRYINFDIISMTLRQAARAMARNKEEKIFNMWYKIAKVTHDNADPANSAYGNTTGRDLSGAFNGTLTMDDIFEMYAQVLAHGWTPNLLLLHPLTWLMFIGDAQLRAFAQQNGGAWFGSQWTGNPAVKDYPDGFGGRALTGGVYRAWPTSTGHAPKSAEGDALPHGVDDFASMLQTTPVLPGYLGLPFRIVVSPFVPYDSDNNTTHILMADSNELGFYIEEHGPQTSEWTDPETDILKIKIKERYQIRPKNRGLGLAIAKNVVVDSNKIILPAQATIGLDGSVDTSVDRDAALV